MCAWGQSLFIWDMGSCVLSKHIELLGGACQAVEMCSVPRTLTADQARTLDCACPVGCLLPGET